MNWKPEYDAVSQQGFSGRPGSPTVAIRIPLWLLTYMVEHRLEDVDPRLATRLLREACVAPQGHTRPNRKIPVMLSPRLVKWWSRPHRFPWIVPENNVALRKACLEALENNA